MNLTPPGHKFSYQPWLNRALLTRFLNLLILVGLGLAILGWLGRYRTCQRLNLSSVRSK